jgi:hypothetical protein
MPGWATCRRLEPITFKLDKFTEMQFRAKANPDAEDPAPLTHRSDASVCPRT